MISNPMGFLRASSENRQCCCDILLVSPLIGESCSLEHRHSSNSPRVLFRRPSRLASVDRQNERRCWVLRNPKWPDRSTTE